MLTMVFTGEHQPSPNFKILLNSQAKLEITSYVNS